MMDLWRQLMRQVRLIAGTGRVTRSLDTAGLQRVQCELLAGETRDLPRLQDYGLTTVPLPGALLVTLSLAAQRQQSVVIRCEDGRYRKAGLKPGEVCLYTDEGDFIHFQRGRKITVVAGAEVSVAAPIVTTDCDTARVTATSSATLTAPVITLDGAVTVTGLLTAQAGIAASGGSGVTVAGSLNVTGGDVTADGKSLKSHTHPYTDNGTTLITGGTS